MAAPVCPYCGNPSELVDSSAVYSRSYGPIWLCRPCKAWVGVHKATNEPLGTLANAELRDLRVQTHALLDPLWKFGQAQMGKKARGAVYAWLAGKLGIEIASCHVGMFDAARCRQAIGTLQDASWESIQSQLS